jgi:hypothetical protein
MRVSSIPWVLSQVNRKWRSRWADTRLLAAGGEPQEGRGCGASAAAAHRGSAFGRLMGEATLMAVAVRKRPENPPVTYLHRQSL